MLALALALDQSRCLTDTGSVRFIKLMSNLTQRLTAASTGQTAENGGIKDQINGIDQLSHSMKTESFLGEIIFQTFSAVDRVTKLKLCKLLLITGIPH